MDKYLIIFPPLTLFLSAILCFLFRFYTRIRNVIAITGTTLFLITALFLTNNVYYNGVQAVQIGNWPAPFGITLVADMISCLMLSISSVIAIAILVYGFEEVDKERRSKGFFPVFFFLLFGICGTFLTGDIFNLYVWFEVMLLSSFVLISLGNTRAQLEGSVKYVVLSLIASGFLLTGVAIVYKSTGTLNMAELSVILKSHPDKGIITLAAIFFFMSFGIKSAVFPLFSWLPASYHTPPVTITGLLAALLTKVGVYALIRFFSLLFTHDMELTHTALLIISGFTMLTGVLGAIAQKEVRRLLSFHIISQIGYMVMGLAIFTPLALAGAVFFILHNILAKTNLFLISGIVKACTGSFWLKKTGNVYDRFPFVALLFAISAFSLAGVPPLPGFWGKLMLAKAGFEAGEYTIVIVSLLVGLLTLFSMTKIWLKSYWDKPPDEEHFLPEYAGNISENTMGNLFRAKFMMILPAAFLALLILIFSVYAEFLVNLSFMAADQLLNPEEYIKAVLKNN